MLELVVRVVLSLAVVLGLFWLVARTGSRRLGVASGAPIRVVGRKALGRSASMAVVEVGARTLVLGVSDSGVRLLVELAPDELVVEADQSVVADSAPAGAARAGRRAVRPTGVGGSVLSPATWRQAWAAVSSRPGRPTTFSAELKAATARMDRPADG